MVVPRVVFDVEFRVLASVGGPVFDVDNVAAIFLLGSVKTVLSEFGGFFVFVFDHAVIDFHVDVEDFAVPFEEFVDVFYAVFHRRVVCDEKAITFELAH